MLVIVVTRWHGTPHRIAGYRAAPGSTLCEV